MKKTGILALVLLMLIGMTACGSGGKTVGPAEDMNTMSSVEELSEAINCALIRPEDVELSNEVMGILEEDGKTIGKYSFTVNDTACWIRCCPDATADDDISGMNNDGGSIFALADENAYFLENDDFKTARWMTVDGQYVFMVEDGGSREWGDFESLCNQFREVAPKNWTSDVPYESYQELVGYYGDSEVMLGITIRYDHLLIAGALTGEGGSESWETEAYLKDGVLVYDKEITSINKYDQASGKTESTEAEGPGGMIIVNEDGSLDCSGVQSPILSERVLFRMR